MPRKNKSSAPAAPRPLTGPQRLNKILAAAGLGSRREVEQYIIDGRIEVDGNPVTDLATKVDPETAKLTFDGSAIRIFRPVYFALNKPVGVLSTNRDPSGRMRAIDLVNVKERIFSAGRLDRSSEGLMLLTNDGELAQRLAHPRYGIQKLYMATVQGEVTQVDLEKLIRGVRLAEGYAKVDAVKVRRQRSGSADLEIALSEGKNREIRRILARLGHKVVALKRLAIGPLRLGQLPTGGWRPLTRDEIQALYAATVGGRRKKRGSGKATRKRTPDESTAPDDEDQLSLGQFDHPSGFDNDDSDFDHGDFNHGNLAYDDDQFNDHLDADDDSDDDDFGSSADLDPSLLKQVEREYQEFGDDDDDELIELHGRSAPGTVISYDDDDSDHDSSDDSHEAHRDATPRLGGRSKGRPAKNAQRSDTSSRRGSSSSRSPHDLRNRNRSSEASSPGRAKAPRARPSSRSSTSARTSSGPRSGPRNGPRSGPKNGPRSGEAQGSSKVARSGSSHSSRSSTGSSQAGDRSAKRSPARSAKRSPGRPTGTAGGRPTRTGGAGSSGRSSSRSSSRSPNSRSNESRSTESRPTGSRQSNPRSSNARGSGSSGGRSLGNKNSGARKSGTNKPGIKKRGNGSGGKGRGGGNRRG